MEIIICGIMGAVSFVPAKPTYAIQIASVPPVIRDLQCPPYMHVFQYFFGDLERHDRIRCPSEGIHISEHIASKILTDFAQNREGIETLLVHCTKGKNRSPSVALALNTVFGLGHNNDDLIQNIEEVHPNRLVYGMLISQAERLGFYKK